MKTLPYMLFLIGFSLLSFVAGYNVSLKNGHMAGDACGLPAAADTVRVRDTVERPVAVRTAVVRHDTVFVAGDTVYLPVERKEYAVHVENDTVRGSIRGIVSGYDASLDSLFYDLSFTRERVTVAKRKRWGWNVTCGPGIGYDGRGVRPFVGVTVGFGYNF